MAHFLRKLALLALAVAAACSDNAPSAPPPLDRFYYPTGLAVRKLASGNAQLVVASSNFDLLYDSASGGTVIAVDVDETLRRGAGAAPGTPIPLADPRAVRLGSFSGELAIAEPATCSGFTGTPQALVASRSDGALYRFDLDDSGVRCDKGDACRTPLETTIDDPYGVTLACVAATPPQLLAYVGYLRAQASAGVLTRVDLAASPPGTTRVDISAGTASSAAFDAATQRLYVTTRFIGVGSSPLRWLDLAAPGNPATIIDLDPQIRGNEMRGIALSSSDPTAPPRPRRGYLPLRLYDFDFAASIGRPPNDVGAALAVLDLSDSPGLPATVKLLRLVPLPRGASEVRVIARPGTGKRDLVAVTSTDDGSLTLYDDETESIARVFGRCGTTGVGDAAPCRPGVDDGKPALGQQPFGLAVEQSLDVRLGKPPRLARLYVGSFERSWVNVIEIDPANPSATTVPGAAPGSTYQLRWDRIGLERP
ncbi:MAG: hypothetical protein ACJ79L_05935 [Anaeromyxobacteraceae bacterium]